MTDVEITSAHCQSCGACCQTSRASSPRVGVGLPPGVIGAWVNCTPEDVHRMRRRVRLKLIPVKTGDARALATPLRVDGTCGFLRGVVGERVECSIYETRPTLCRKYEAGSEYCRASRREVGLSA